MLAAVTALITLGATAKEDGSFLVDTGSNPSSLAVGTAMVTEGGLGIPDESARLSNVPSSVTLAGFSAQADSSAPLTEEGGVNESSSGDHGQQMSPLGRGLNLGSPRTASSTSPPAVSGADSSSGADLLRQTGVAQPGRASETFREVEGSNPVPRAEGHPRGFAPDSCRALRKAVRYYRAAHLGWLAKMGAPLGRAVRTGRVPGLGESSPSSCPHYLAALWQRKARAARRAFERWHAYHWDWRSWLPDKWQRLGACETGYGRRPGDWTWDSGQYVSAFGIYRPGYADDAHRIGQLSWDETIRKLHRLPTPREQWNAALSHYRAHGGFSGWGCRGA